MFQETPKSLSDLRTAQDIYDYVKAKLLEQGRQSINTGNLYQCVYRSPDGCKCAAGWLIADERYTSDLEGCYASDPTVLSAIRDSIPYAVGIDPKFLRLLQKAHDGDGDFDNVLPADYQGLEKNFKETIVSRLTLVAKAYVLKP